jgi:hypothetical protein
MFLTTYSDPKSNLSLCQALLTKPLILDEASGLPYCDGVGGSSASFTNRFHFVHFNDWAPAQFVLFFIS